MIKSDVELILDRKEDVLGAIGSKKKKKEAEELQQLGLELAELSVLQLGRIDIPENLRAALIEGKSITSNIAGRRHRQGQGGHYHRLCDPQQRRHPAGEHGHRRHPHGDFQRGLFLFTAAGCHHQHGRYGTL